MIDTIIFRIHDLKENEKFVNLLKGYEKGFSRYKVNYETGELEDSATKFMGTIEYIRYHKSMNYVELTPFESLYMSDLNLPSSHYKIIYRIDYIRDFIEFNFSIPKYIYGQNITQFINHYWSPSFTPMANNDFDYNVSVTFKKLKEFIKNFLKLLMNENQIPWYQVEICRIDFCYNQVFDSKQDALEYLKCQKEIRKKYSRDTSNFSRDWTTTLAYKTQNYFAKVYHKGSEYKKNDSKEHAKINKDANKQIFNVPFLQDLSDKILRYEITFRHNYFSYLYRRKIFRRNDRNHQLNYQRYKLLDSIYKAKGLGSLSESDRKFYNYFKKMLYKTDRFFLYESYPNNDVFEYYTKTPDNWANYEEAKFNYSYARFSNSLFIELANTFKQFIDEYQVRELSPADTLIKKILGELDKRKEYNSINKTLIEKKILKRKVLYNTNSLKMLISLITKYSYEEIEKLELFEKRTWFRYKAMLNDLGIDKRNTTTLQIIPPKVDFSKYHDIFIRNSNNLITKASMQLENNF